MRRRLHLTQRQFAERFGFPVATLRHWERGNRTPNRAAITLLQVIRANPRVVRDAVRRFRVPVSWWDRTEYAPPHRGPRGLGRRPRIPI